jgi:chemotaxis signal transduction protein
LDERRCITFSIGEYRFAVPIDKVREILNVTGLLPIPGGREPLEGIVPYRAGTVLPVFSLLGLLGGRGNEASDLIVVAGSEESPVGFRVGSMGGVLVVSEAEEESLPYEGDLKAPEGVITGILKKPEGEHILLEFDRMFDT